MIETRSTCCYCGVGCGVVVGAEQGRIVSVRGDPDHPANFGRLCTKGSALHLTLDPAARLLYPELRDERAGPRRRASWDEALDFAADRFAQAIRAHGPDSVAFYVSGQLLTEDYYVFNKLARALVGTNNIDTNSRLCMSSAVSGYKLTLGADAVPTCYEDIDLAHCILIAGANTAYAHPVVFQRIEQARARNPDLKIIVADPRRTDTAACADLHLPLLPGTDVALFNSMLHVALWEGLCDLRFVEAHTSGFEAVREAVAEYTPGVAAEICGIPAADIVRAARWFARAPGSLSLYCQGLNQSVQGTDKNVALINLHLATGQIGRPGAGPFSLTGQPNAMGGREVGGMATLLSAHRDPHNPLHRAEMARFWGVDSLPETPGQTAVEMFEAVREGRIKAIWIACTNPVHSMPDQSRVAQALERADCVVLQEAFRRTDTAAYADVMLPAAAWGEKDGTVTNSERRISRVRASLEPVGEAWPDWRIVREFGRRLGTRIGRPGAGRLFPYRTAAEIFDEHCASTRGTDLDIEGMSHAILDRAGPQQWPLAAGAQAGKPRLYTDLRFATEDGRARFVPVRLRPVAEPTDARFPLHLITGRLRDQWHGMSRTSLAARLFNHADEPVLSMNSEDMVRRGVHDGELVRVSSRRGALVVRARAAEEMRATQVFLPMHWGGMFMRGAGSNALTTSAFDPMSRQPEFKHAAVRVEPANLPFQVIALRSGQALRCLDAARPLLERFEYASCGFWGRERAVAVFRAAAAAPVEESLISKLDEAFELTECDDTLSYRDARRRISKRVRVDDGIIVGARLAGETAAREWLKELIAAGAPIDAARQWVLAPLARPPAGHTARGRILCNCFDVAEMEVRQRLAAGFTLVQLQDALKCGTSCGSCVPELKRMAREAQARAAA